MAASERKSIAGHVGGRVARLHSDIQTHIYIKKSCDQRHQLKAQSSHMLWDSNTEGSYSETPSVNVDAT